MKVKVVIPSSSDIAQKGNGRIFVQSEDEVQKVHDIIKEMDASEYESYMPKDFVTVFSIVSNSLIYTHKFDINVSDLIIKCMEEDIYVVVYSCNDYQFDDSLTLESAIQRDLKLAPMSDFVYNKTKDW